MLKRLSEWVQRRWFPAVPVAVGVALALPSLWVGIQADDLFIRATVLGTHPFEGVLDNPFEPYSYLDGDPDRTRILVDRGWFPWWSDPQCRSSLGRPLAALTFMLDYRVWPDWPVLMHVQSLIWFALLIGAASLLYRRMMGRTPPVWTAGLAALLFAVEDAHALPAGWLANRNALIAGFFGCVTLIAHDRWRRNGWRAGAWVAPVALVLGLLGKEEAVCTGGYLLAYAVFMERGRLRKRATSLWPCLLAGVVWFVWYQWAGYGVYASGVYVDPTNEPLRFLQNIVRNGPILLLGQWGLPPADVSLFWSAAAFRIHWVWAVVFLSVLGAILAPLVLRDSRSRFWCMGMILSVAPVCAIFSSDRLLMFVSLGAMGLLGQWLVGVGGRAPWVPSSISWGRLARVFKVLFVGSHLILAPVLFPALAVSMRFVGAVLNDVYDTLPDDPDLADQTVVFVSSLNCVGDLMWIQSRLDEGRPVPARSLNLSPSCSSATLTRIDERTIAVRPHGGYLRPRGWSPFGAGDPPYFSFGYLPQHLDRLFRSDDRRMTLGEQIELTAATIAITELTEDGRPAEATFRFRVPLEDGSLRWLAVTRNGFVPFVPPSIGESVEVASPLQRTAGETKSR